MVALLDRLPDWGLVLTFAATLAFAVWANLDPFGYTRVLLWDVPNLFFEALAVALLYLEYREMRSRGWF
jgi:hypothetical protein